MDARLLAVAAVGLTLSAASCTSGTDHTGGAVEAPASSPAGALDEVVVGPARFSVPQRWSFYVSRQDLPRPSYLGGSWSFAFSARHAFNVGKTCARRSGPLGRLLRFEEVFLLGSAHRDESPPPDDFRQQPGEFRLDPASRGSYEGTGCRRMYRLSFEKEGYVFNLQVAVSKTASLSARRELLTILNSDAAS